jgi:hypothetical protein
MDKPAGNDATKSKDKMVRYDFWSLMKALESGMIHGDTSAVERAKKIVDNLASLPASEQEAKIKCIGAVATYLGAIEQELVTRQLKAGERKRDASGIETVELPPVTRVSR